MLLQKILINLYICVIDPMWINNHYLELWVTTYYNFGCVVFTTTVVVTSKSWFNGTHHKDHSWKQDYVNFWVGLEVKNERVLLLWWRSLVTKECSSQWQSDCDNNGSWSSPSQKLFAIKDGSQWDVVCNTLSTLEPEVTIGSQHTTPCGLVSLWCKSLHASQQFHEAYAFAMWSLCNLASSWFT